MRLSYQTVCVCAGMVGECGNGRDGHIRVELGIRGHFHYLGRFSVAK